MIAAPELWNRLAAEGLAHGEMPKPAERPTPWPVRVMLGAAGWAGSLFLLGFAGAVFSNILNHPGPAFSLGIGSCAFAYLLFRSFPHNDFAQQAGLAVSLAGQALLVVAVGQTLGEHRLGPAFLVLAAIAAGLALLLPNYLHRVLSALAANALLFLAAGTIGAPALATAVTAAGACALLLREESLLAAPDFWEPLAYGFLIALLPMDASIFVGPGFWRWLYDSSSPPVLLWLGPVVSGLAILCVALWLRRRLDTEADGSAGLLGIAGVAVIALCGCMAPGISASLLVTTLGFASGRRTAIGLGLFAFVAYLGNFYYQLQVTLLVKSIVLSGTGVALLILWYFVHRGGRRPA
ncbi:MAG TPA: DUF4401 domain-containing protein [Bryobacteraceae bacterium]|nr:DUF4401 domain-containing protein [Bryobacteraceae bacterium]